MLSAGEREGQGSEGFSVPPPGTWAPRPHPRGLAAAPTMLSWDCSSISRACMVRRSSETSHLLLCASSQFVVTSRFSSSVCKQDTGQGSVSPASLLQVR